MILSFLNTKRQTRVNLACLLNLHIKLWKNLINIEKTRTHGVTRHSRDRQGRVSVRRLGLVYMCGGVLRDLREMPRDIEMHWCVSSCFELYVCLECFVQLKRTTKKKRVAKATLFNKAGLLFTAKPSKLPTLT